MRGFLLQKKAPKPKYLKASTSRMNKKRYTYNQLSQENIKI